MIRTVVLHHRCPDRPDHYDWLIDQPEIHSERRVLTFRTQDRPDLSTREFHAEKAPDHRAFYLGYEGELSDGRGRVDRVAEGVVLEIHKQSEAIKLKVSWDDRLRAYEARLGPRIAGQDRTVWTVQTSPIGS